MFAIMLHRRRRGKLVGLRRHRKVFHEQQVQQLWQAVLKGRRYHGDGGFWESSTQDLVCCEWWLARGGTAAPRV